MANLSTTKQLKRAFEDLATRHKFINSFHWVKDSDLGASIKVIYPALVVHPIDATMLKAEDGTFKMMEYKFIVKVLDLTEKDESNELDVESDTLQILTEIVNELNLNFDNSNIVIQDDVTFEPLDEYSDDEATGWQGDLTIKTPVNNSNCFLPFK